MAETGIQWAAPACLILDRDCEVQSIQPDVATRNEHIDRIGTVDNNVIGRSNANLVFTGLRERIEFIITSAVRHDRLNQVSFVIEPVLNREQVSSHVSLTNDNAPLVSLRADSSANANSSARPVATLVIVISERPSDGLIVSRSVATQLTPVTFNARPANQALGTDGLASTLRASDTLAQKTASGMGSGIPVENSGMDQAQPQDSVPLSSPTNAPAPMNKLHFGTASSSANDGYIQLLPLWQTDPLQSDSETKEWKIDSNIIPRIRNALQSPLHRIPELADLAMRDWFAGPGGLIDLDHGGSTALFFPVPSELINVELKSIVGLHRSLELIAAGVTEPISGPMLDAILASIEDITASESQPIAEAAPFRLPTVAYTALAVVASSVTIAAHRRRTHLSHPEAEDAKG